MLVNETSFVPAVLSLGPDCLGIFLANAGSAGCIPGILAYVSKTSKLSREKYS